MTANTSSSLGKVIRSSKNLTSGATWSGLSETFWKEQRFRPAKVASRQMMFQIDGRDLHSYLSVPGSLKYLCCISM